MVRRHAVVLTLALAPVLTGCSGDPGIVSDGSDLDAAVAVWSDPWVAPTSATVAGPALGSNGQVDRVVARRTTSYDAGVEATVRAELAVAQEAGWRTTSSTCGDTVQVALAGPGDALAQLVVTPNGPGSDAAVQAATRHHLDAAWQVPTAVDATCLDGESPAFKPPRLQSAPLGGDDPDDPDEEPVEWSDDAPSTVAAANADPALAALGVEVAEPRLESGVNRRQAPAAEVDVAAGTLAALARRLAGWHLTYAACGGGGPTRATFVRTIDELPAVLSAVLVRNGAELRVTLPTPEGPGGSWVADLPSIDPTTSCASSDVEAGPVVVLGTPAVLPSDLTPIVE